MNEQVCVIRVDGGICSQLAFVAYGIAAARTGERIKYDLTWFRVCGLDVLREQVRNWDIPKLLPGLELSVASDEEVRLAREGRNGYRYVSGYPDRDPALLACANLFKPLMKPQLDSASARLLERILNTSSCAIHVRRGDLAEGNSDYGRPTTLDYFKRAISFERSMTAGQVDFYVFTDDAEWCKENIMPLLAWGGVSVRERRGQGLCRFVPHVALRRDHILHRQPRRLRRRAVGQESGLVSVTRQEAGAGRRERRLFQRLPARTACERTEAATVSANGPLQDSI